jgi:hypothetical protein
MTSTSIEALWTRLDPKTQEWLRANPGSVILPRSVTEALLRAGDQGEHQETLEGVDRHGQFLLSPQDQAFLKSVASSAPVDHPVPPGTP